MAKILFRVLPESGHMNASFGLARELVTRGHRVVYASIDEYEAVIESQGFGFYRLDREIGWGNQARFSARTTRSPLFWLRMQMGKYAFLRKMREDLLDSTAFHREILSLEPDLVFVDSSFVRYVLGLHSLGVPFAVIESQVAPDYETNVPPPISRLVPEDTRISRFKCNLEWLLYFSTRSIAQFFGMHAVESKSFMKRLCQSTGFDYEAIDFKRCFRIGLRSNPEIIVSTPELDFPRTPKANQCYLRTAISSSRSEISYDYRFDRVFAETLAWKASKDFHNLIYCSFGGMSFRYRGMEDFFRRLIRACSGLDKVRLLISLGNELNLGAFEPCPANVFLFRRVPQLKVLQEADLMVMHGGTNSISECILAGVPMLAYPGAVDQPGNAARIVYHGMGLMGKLNRESSDRIKRKIETILNDESFSVQVRNKRNRIMRNSAPDKIDRSINAILNLVAKMTTAKL